MNETFITKGEAQRKANDLNTRTHHYWIVKQQPNSLNFYLVLIKLP